MTYKIDPYYNYHINLYLSLKEMGKSLLFMENTKSLRKNGLVSKFFKSIWSHIKDEFYKVYLNRSIKGILGPDMNKGIIKVISKGNI